MLVCSMEYLLSKWQIDARDILGSEVANEYALQTFIRVVIFIILTPRAWSASKIKNNAKISKIVFSTFTHVGKQEALRP